ncbi:hypothetical protein ACQKWADRAFT_289775, partial [Trichoderma austrokoningii]
MKPTPRCHDNVSLFCSSRPLPLTAPRYLQCSRHLPLLVCDSGIATTASLAVIETSQLS